mmetsp:Transcript_19129/g.44326  ORF Transcript_19129/g.44326 Transcript_19129/m.44326 type:complete len:214 (-) Transcript_19129:652-1293(-)
MIMIMATATAQVPPDRRGPSRRLSISSFPLSAPDCSACPTPFPNRDGSSARARWWWSRPSTSTPCSASPGSRPASRPNTPPNRSNPTATSDGSCSGPAASRSSLCAWAFRRRDSRRPMSFSSPPICTASTVGPGGWCVLGASRDCWDWSSSGSWRRWRPFRCWPTCRIFAPSARSCFRTTSTTRRTTTRSTRPIGGASCTSWALRSTAWRASG